MSASETSVNVPALFHTVLFAYQKKLKEVLGTGEAIFTHPILKLIGEIDREKNLVNFRGKTTAEILENFAQDLVASKVVEKAWFEGSGQEEFVFHIEKCAFASQTHDSLKPKDVVCPLALVGMSIFTSVTNKKVRLTESEFTDDGCTTSIA
jgi:hypothetical protein